MEEDEHTDRKQQLALLSQKLNKIKKSLNEDDSDNFSQIISSNSPEVCCSYLTYMEKKWDPQQDRKHLSRLIDLYNRLFSSMSHEKHCQNESYARMMIRFAELNAIQDPTTAEANFSAARAYSQNFAFVHIAHAQFELSQGNTKRAMHILQNGLKVGAKPTELLEATLQSMLTGKMLLCSEDKENVSTMFPNNPAQESLKKDSEFKKVDRKSDGTGDLQLSSIFSAGMEPLSGSSDEGLSGWRTRSHRKAAVGMPGRVPVLPFSIPEKDDEEENTNGCISGKGNMSVPRSGPRQGSGSNGIPAFGLSSSRKSTESPSLADDQTPARSTNSTRCNDVADSTTTLLQTRSTRDLSTMEDITFSFGQVLNSNSPELCWTYLLNLEKRGNPHTDISLLNKLKDCYSKVFDRMPIRLYSKNTSYARILVRYAELKGIDDPDEAQDHFIVARSSCKYFAFVHIAHAQFEVSQGNLRKAASILHKAQAWNAKPAELLDLATQNLRAGLKQLVPSVEEEEEESCTADGVPNSEGIQETQLPTRIPLKPLVDLPKPSNRDPISEWKVPAVITRHVSPEDKRITPPDPKPLPFMVESLPTPSTQFPARLNQQVVYQTPNSYKNQHVNSFITPVVKQDQKAYSSAVSTHRTSAAESFSMVQQPFTHLSQSAGSQNPQASVTSLSKESLTIKGKQFIILKTIGRGGSSKVYQVLDHKKQLFAVKHVNLEEADDQTVESYKNEIEHLNHLQQYSDQIIKLYDYEITSSYIFMLMECGNLDLNTWLRHHKTVNPFERKFYWKNMLEAVQTIHKHGIVHSDLKPANFVIVNASLKLIDFGIANRIQPDVTSIMKDSQVGTLNYMPPEAIKDTSSQPGKARSKISPKGDVWSLGCILYYMTYGKTPFQSITSQIAKLHAIIDPTHKIDFPDIPEKDLLDVLKRCLVRNPRERISIAELLEHPYLQLKPQSSEPVYPSTYPTNHDLEKILWDLAALNSPNSIIRAANNLAKQCSSGKKLDVAECAKSTPS